MFAEFYVYYIIDIVSGNLLSLLLNKQILEVFYSDVYSRAIICLIIKSIDILAMILLYKVFKKSYFSLSKRVWYLFNVVLFVFLAVAMTYVNIYQYQELDYSMTLTYTIVSVSFLIMSAIVIYFFTYICKSFGQSKSYTYSKQVILRLKKTIISNRKF